MSKRTVVMAAMFSLAFAVAIGAQEKPKVIMKTPPRVDPTDAPAMFREYCAPCHGATAIGNGPAAPALKAVPADLTRISARNGGKFPGTKVRRYIEGLDEIPAHGTRDMPVWGRVLRSGPDDAAVRLRVEALTKYLESLQK
jgi:mono/diheme cytochrome c family protein